MRERRKLVVLAGVVLATLPLQAKACYYHWLMGTQEPDGQWPTLPNWYAVPQAPSTDAAGAVAQLQAQDSADDAAVAQVTSGLSAAAPAAPAAPVVTDPTIVDWMLNTAGTHGSSTNGVVNSVVSKVLADVQVVAYTNTNVYIKSTGVPSHVLGSYGADPAIPTNVNRTFDLTRTPTQNTGTLTSTGLGTIGVGLNGVSFYNAWDGMYFNQSSGGHTWQQNANFFESSTFDGGPGHPSPIQGQTVTTSNGSSPAGNYHYHEEPLLLINQLDPANTGQHASPVIGYALDGYPIFGPYGYVVDSSGNIVFGTNGQPEVQLMTSSYQLQIYTGGVRGNGGPTLAQEPNGYYLNDYAYQTGTGTLDSHNGRFAAAPGYPQGTYGYYVTSTYPYIIGPTYYGVVQTDNLPNGTVTVPGNATFYVPVPEPVGLSAIVFSLPLLRRRRRS